MGQNSAIEWTQVTWNPVAGCTKVSPGCQHCYAERMSKRLAAMAFAAEDRGENPGRLAGYLHVINSSGHWNNKIRVNEDALRDPIGWRAPRFVFVNSMSDLFHKDVPLKFIQQVFAVMNQCTRHTFQILTKRPERASELSAELRWTPNIWMGTSVESAEYASRIDYLGRTAARIKFLSVEPLLGPIPNLPLQGIHWVIVGGESGPGARSIERRWVAQIRDRCIAQGVAFFFKQWGGVNKKRSGRLLDGRTWDEMPVCQPGNSRSTSADVRLATAHG